MTSRFRAALFLFLFTVMMSAGARAQNSPPDPNKAAVIRFFAGVDFNSIGVLLQAVDGQYKAGVRRYVILISSPGGDILSGLMAYNYLKGLQVDITTVNVGAVDSAAGLLYCAGNKRYSVPEARFIIHEAALTITANGQINIDVPALESQLTMLKSQETTIAKILAETAHRPQADAEKKIHAQQALSAQEAKDWGLVQDIRTQLFDPNDSNLVQTVPVPPVTSISPLSQPPAGVPTVPQFSYSSKP